ncbi:MAG: hypothetical protein ACNI25_05835 [Halarcobacter sp.]
MTIDNNINSMIASEMKINGMASNVAQIGSQSQITNKNENPEVTKDLIDSIVGQIPEVISYQANAKGIETQQEVSDMLLNIKA